MIKKEITEWQNPEEDFFNMVKEEEEIKDKAEDKVEEKEDNLEKEESQISEATDKEDLFNKTFIEKEEEEEDSNKTSAITLLEDLKKRGLYEYELEEGEELTEEKAETILEDSYDNAVDEKLQSLMEEIPDNNREVIKYMLDGGNIKELLKTMAAGNVNSLINKDLDIEDEKQIEAVTREILALEKEDEESIDTQIEFLKDSGKLQSFGEKKLNKWLGIRKKEKDIVLNQNEKRKQEEKDSLKNSIKKTTEYLTTNNNIGMINISREDRKLLPSYINNKTIKLKNGNSISMFQKELFMDLPKNEDAFLQLALLMKNRNKDGTFNFEDIEKKVRTKVTKGVKNNITRSSKGLPEGSQSIGRKPTKSLVEYFD